MSNRNSQMEEGLKQDALLRHLLSREKCADDDFVYSFLLGSRLFLSPHQLLTELQRLSSENTTSEIHLNSATKNCLKCRKLQSKSPDISAAKRLRSRGTDFRSQKFPSSVSIDLTTNVDGRNEETVRRRPPGRRLSRDSGILSGIIETLQIDNNNSATALFNHLQANCNDSGYIMPDDEFGCNECLRKLERETCIKSKHQMLLILREWVRHFPADFRNKRTMWTLNDVIRSCQTDNEDLSSLCTEVIDCISRRTATQENYEQQLNDSDHLREFKPKSALRKNKEWMLKIVLKLKDAADVNAVAQQLCLIEMDLLKHVGAEEFLQLFTADGAEDVKNNLGACVRWFNRLSRLVATLICMCRKRKHARQVITFFARVANRSFELSNFNSSMAILTGLSFGPVTRLKKAWNKLVLSELTKLQTVFDPSNNFLRYRSVYTSRAEQLHTPTSAEESSRYSLISQHSVRSGVSSQHGDSGIEYDHDSSPPTTSPTGFQAKMSHFTFDPAKLPHDGVMVPFLVLLVKDVYFLNHAIQTVDDSGNINLEKLRNLANILKPLEEWKQMTSPYTKHDQLQDFLLKAPVQDDGELYLLSYKREAPTNRFEKLQLKSLKTERDMKKKNGTLPAKSARSKTV